MIPRFLEKTISESLFMGKAIVLYGARQVGKTTLVRSILSKYPDSGKYLNCEIHSINSNLSVPEPERIKNFLGGAKLVVLDEAQYIPNTGKILKLIVDTIPQIQIIATGSSGFDLANKTSEAMTGRVYHFHLHPLSVNEIASATDPFIADSAVESILRFGAYPEVYTSVEDKAMKIIDEISSSYLYKDILMFDDIRKSGVIKNLLIMLALQVGNEVSYNELAKSLGINRLTVIKYLDLLEGCFVIFRLNSFSRNLRSELSKSVKIYFFDLGIRNSLIRNFNPMGLREDSGRLWENFCIVERLKMLNFMGKRVNSFFWRTYNKKEIDYVEESDGIIRAFEFKYSSDKRKNSYAEFESSYNTKVEVVNRSNFYKFIQTDREG